MSTNFNDLILTLYRGLGQSKDLKPETQAELQFGLEFSLKNYSNKTINTRTKIGHFLQTIITAVHHEDNLNETCVLKVINSVEEKENQKIVDCILESLPSEQFQNDVLALLTTQISMPRGGKDIIFPGLAKRIKQLQEMFQYCVSQADDSEELEVDSDNPSAQGIMLTLLADLRLSPSSDSYNRSYVQQRGGILSAIIHIEETTKGNAPNVSEICFFLEALVEAYADGNDLDRLRAQNILSLLNKVDGSKGLGYSLLAALPNKKLREALLNLFKDYPERMTLLAQLFEICLIHHEALLTASESSINFSKCLGFEKPGVDSEKQLFWDSPIGMRVISGFVIVLGGAAVFAGLLTLLLAFPPVTVAATVLIATTAAIVAGSMIVGGVVSGVGFFKHFKPTVSQDTESNLLVIR